MKHPSAGSLRRYVLDEAGSAERLDVEQHLAACARCREHVAQHARLDEWLAESCPVPDRPHGARDAFDRLWAEVDAQDARTASASGAHDASRHAARRAAAWLLPLAAAAAVLAALLWWKDHARAPAAGPERQVAAGSAAVEAGTVERPSTTPSAPPLVVPEQFASEQQASAQPALEHATPAPEHGAVRDAVGDDSVARDAPGQVAVGRHAAGHDAALQVAAAPDAGEDRFDPARLDAVRARLADVLRSAAAGHPDDDAAFAAACAETDTELRAAGWPVPMLLRGLAHDGEHELGQAALRLAACATDCDAVLADALAATAPVPAPASALLATPSGAAAPATHGAHDPRAALLARLLAAPRRPHAAPLVAALGALAAQEQGDSGAGLALRRAAATLLARDGQPAARLALDRALDAALSAAAEDRAALPALLALAEAAPADVTTGALLQAGARGTTRDVATACYAQLAAGDRAGFGVALDGLLPRLPDAQRRLAAGWAAACALEDALPGLCAALAAQPDDEALLVAITDLGGADAARGLATVLLAEHGSAEVTVLRAALVTCVQRDESAVPAAAQALASSRGDELTDVARALPVERRGAWLLAALDALAADGSREPQRQAVLTALACEGSAADGRALMAWIDSRPGTDAALALAWTTAYCLSGAEAAEVWRDRGHDPALLARAVGDRSAWPHAAPTPPSRRLRPIADTLRRAARPPLAASASVLKETL